MTYAQSLWLVQVPSKMHTASQVCRERKPASLLVLAEEQAKGKFPTLRCSTAGRTMQSDSVGLSPFLPSDTFFKIKGSWSVQFSEKTMNCLNILILILIKSSIIIDSSEGWCFPCERSSVLGFFSPCLVSGGWAQPEEWPQSPVNDNLVNRMPSQAFGSTGKRVEIDQICHRSPHLCHFEKAPLEPLRCVWVGSSASDPPMFHRCIAWVAEVFALIAKAADLFRLEPKIAQVKRWILYSR